jgi:hypothetical protein
MDKQFLLKQIELLTDKGIGLISLSSITGKNNTKKNYGGALRDFGYGGDSWLNIQNMTYEDLKKDIYRGILGFIIKTGKYSNIVCIDWDNKQHIIDTYKAVEQRLRNGEIISNTDKDMITYNNYIKSLSIRDELIKKEFLYAKTPSGGYHFICKYDEKIFSTNNRGLLGNIDIRTDGGCIFFGIRDDGRYEYNDCKIKAVPKKITDILYPIIKNKIDINVIK